MRIALRVVSPSRYQIKAMPLSSKTLLSAFDGDTQVLLSSVYVELCASLLGHLDEQNEVRQRIADELVRQAFLGERDPGILKRKALAASAT